MPDHLRLTRDLTRPLAEPVWPDGVVPAPFSATLAPRVHALMQAAYAAGGGSVSADFDVWWATMRHDPEFDAALCFVAVSDGDPVGFAHCWTSGFVKDLVVHPAWQGKGIGTALLRAALRSLTARGHTEAALKVEADNTRARRLYEGLGFESD